MKGITKAETEINQENVELREPEAVQKNIHSCYYYFELQSCLCVNI